ncbi:hypothetical protein AKJ41_02975 [candidate division MSBL1 archaeon SCGC-AAA259O05]|uniref:Helix-turn-helix type 11 domain-containing protein n=1 Tax=candidate division MSBL1 archaeon SCGC-AAA259O05 TaxID=1698271 RepID=A0A133V3L7_9EURY|nr:hypothetical protein AKJ41_02975 [candidate division MSBL1 archaeon SCGC-AAA259O05]
MTEKKNVARKKNAESFESINPDRRNAVKKSLRDKIGAENVREFIEGGLQGKREKTIQEISNELGISETTVYQHIKTLKLSEDPEWVLEMADGEIPIIVKALTKAPFDRTETEKSTIKGRAQKNSDEIPNVVKESGELYREPDGLGFKSTVKLARELDRFAKLPLEEQVTVVPEAALRGHRQIRKSLWNAEGRVEAESEKGDEDARG